MQLPVDFNELAFLEMIKQEVTTCLLEALKIVEEECKKTVPIDTAELRDSIHIEGPVWFSLFYAEGRVIAGGPNILQAYFQEFGTKPHGPVRAKAMHFFWKGEEIFAKWVRGCTPLMWMTKATDLSAPLIDRVFKLLEAKSRGFIFTYTVKGPQS